MSSSSPPPDYTPAPTRDQIATAEKELTRIKRALDRSADPDALAVRESESIDRCLSVLIEKSEEPYSTRKWMCRAIKKRLERLQARIQRARDLGRQDGIEVPEAFVLAAMPGFAYPSLRRR